MLLEATIPKGIQFPSSLIEKAFAKRYGVKSCPFDKFVPLEEAFELLSKGQCIKEKSPESFLYMITLSEEIHALNLNGDIRIHPKLLIEFSKKRMQKKIKRFLKKSVCSLQEKSDSL